eukprot:Blabericola_migrator_1__4700@NODE_2480_length_2700_cov_60_042537_g1555_i0_p1_GENE_NODE_2480_length_2700_cov_60_042537_g1555_i0NODE_2480_length_2700_cov_60_042537_g1555_i0_p1_ORF_typecomplete_len434_score133_01MFAP1/PF06991_11/3_5e03MFAP1/PF06991_11/5_3e51PCP_red/PF08369_10/1_8e02PCP_red/PF08369_10/0_19_NODE_2480_length_2700_cov_60_042537_g1555_i012802581
MSAPLNLPKSQPLERRPDLLDPSRPRLENVIRAPRYRAGVIPEYAKAALEETHESAPIESPPLEPQVKRRRVSANDSSSDSGDDILSALSAEEDNGLRRRRAAPKAEVPETVKEESDDEMEGIEETKTKQQVEEEARRRQEMRRRRLLEEQQVQAEAEEAADGADDSVSSNEDSSDSGSESEEFKPLPKPVFRAREERVALQETLEALAARERQMEEDAMRRQAEKEAESQELLKVTVETMEKEDEAERLRRLHGIVDDDENIVLPDDEIHDEDAEYLLWQLREMGRLYRDDLVEERWQREQAEIERRKNMTEAELLEDNKRREKERVKLAAQGKMNFMQKYYHKGVFFQDVVETGKERVFDKDFNAPVGEDAIDKSYLPAAMRVRRGEFGRKGRSKHTHLADVDTTDRTAAWYKQKQPPPLSASRAADRHGR